MKEEVFVCQPPSFESFKFPDHVYKLDKILYGLKQAPRTWYARLSKFLLENGFTRDKINTTSFMTKTCKNLLIAQIYADDIIFGVTNEFLYKAFANLLGSEFEMIMLVELNFFLGLKLRNLRME